MATRETAVASRPLLHELFTSGLYKRNQGRMVRQITCLTIWVFVAAAVWRFHDVFLSNWMGDSNRALSYLVAVALGAAGFWFGYRLVNWPKFADFLISVEAELNKVSWPTQKELVRASIVVIFTILFLSLILFLYDALWKFVFGWLGIS
ncbi:MAG: preprotein translocase subunit SecE [Planctomycetota bacterium]|nr:MAG: preprotein translocase subunit SecE [Planctomycetota bacterium]